MAARTRARFGALAVKLAELTTAGLGVPAAEVARTTLFTWTQRFFSFE